MFFFSSRRRHTRCSRDWSSDVCSSDLGEIAGMSVDYESTRGYVGADYRTIPDGDQWTELSWRRSEERRVGKECRAGGTRHGQKKNAERRQHPLGMEGGEGSDVLRIDVH